MSRTRHHRDLRLWKDPPSWRRAGNRAYRALVRQLMREGQFDLIGHPKRDQRGWYW